MSVQSGLREIIEERAQSLFAGAVIGYGVIIGIIGLFGNLYSPYFEVTMVGILLFGIVEIPRIRQEQISHEGHRMILMAMLVVHASLFIQATNPGVIEIAALIAFIMVLISTVAIALVTEGGVDTGVTPYSTVDDLPYYMAVSGLVLVAVI